MSADSTRTSSGRVTIELGLTLGVFAAVFAALLPLMRVVLPSSWLVEALALVVAILAAGFVARRYRLAAVAVSLVEAAVWVVFVMVFFLRGSALLWVIPTDETVRLVPQLMAEAAQQITVGAAPLRADAPLSLLIVGSAGLLAIVIDHVVITARMPLLAGIGLIAVSLIPAIAVPDEVDVVGFVLLAAALLFLMRIDTRSRQLSSVDAATRTAGIPATAVGIGAVAVIVTLAVTPTLPQPIARAGTGGVGVGNGIDATLQLGDDLRRPREVEVLQMRASSPLPPYLRATTLSTFDGAVWRPDEGSPEEFDPERGMSTVAVADGIRLEEYTTTVDILSLASPWLPVAYPAVNVLGLEGEWSTMPDNRTVITRNAQTQGQTYEVVTNVPLPTREQARGFDASGENLRDDLTALPDDLPAVVGDLAREVTSNTSNDYEALVALQGWFRGPDFRYSLDAPVEEGFDGTGAEAVAEFLDRREGYCIHYAGAFALMARTLDMPSRIVVGYLPGMATTDAVGGETVYSVTSSQLHAWPEVYFEGLGWIAFEPTNSLGTPTSFASAVSLQPGTPGSSGPSAPVDRAGPSAEPSLPPEADAEQNEDDGTAAGPAQPEADPLPTVGVVAAILLLLALPGILREVRRRQLVAAARTGDAASAWLVVQDAAIDLGVAVPASASPRALGARLVAEHGAPRDATGVLVAAVERASYAPDGRHGFGQGDAVADAAVAVSAGLLRAAPLPRRILAVLVPRSLVMRPGSVYAASGSRRRA